MKIYLAGPITGCNFEECTDWREEFKTLMPESVQCLSPMRGKEFLKMRGEIHGSYPELGPLASSRGIMTRDFFDCTRSDLVLVNFYDATIVSVGTCMEVAWAYMNRTPLVCIMEDNNIHEHPMIHEAIGFRVSTLQEAADICQTILWPKETELEVNKCIKHPKNIFH